MQRDGTPTRPPEGGRYKCKRQIQNINEPQRKSQRIVRQSGVAFFHKNIRLGADQYTGQRWFFLTLCCENRRPVFSIPEHAMWLIDMLRQESVSAQFLLYAYCIMPDHLHVLVQGLDTTSDLLAFIKRLKQSTGYEFRKRFHRNLWQKKFHDHILRENETVQSVAAYIWMNPVRKGLCANPSDYPYSGSFVLDWKNAPTPAKPWTPPKQTTNTTKRHSNRPT